MPDKNELSTNFNPWIDLNNSSDLNDLMKEYGNFHDSCLRECYISTTSFVQADRSMHLDSQTFAIFLFQRQSKVNPVLELKFVDLVGLNYQPPAPGYNEVIYDAFLEFNDEVYYWADDKDWTLDGFRNGDTECVWIGAKKLSYRWRPELLGNVTRLKD